MNSKAHSQNWIFEQAFRWIEAMRDGSGEHSAFFAWVAESPRHAEELMFAFALSEEIAELTPEQRKEIEAITARDGGSMAAPENVVPMPDTRTSLTPPHFEGSGRSWRWKVAAALGVMAVAAWLAIERYGLNEYSTGVGEHRMLRLEDGSVVHLNALSRLNVRFTDEARELRLSDGEALFKVARDAARPFRVRVDGAVIQALGTQFDVHRRPSSTVISVIEGKVRISAQNNPLTRRLYPENTQKKQTETLEAGEELKIENGAMLQRSAIVNPHDVTAWQRHRLVFQGDALIDIAAEFNRHNHSPQIRVDGAAVRARQFAGTFDADAPEALIEALQTDDALIVERSGDEIVIRLR